MVKSSGGVFPQIRRRLKQGSPVTPVGNLINVNSWAAFLVAYASVVPGDVINMNHGAYIATTPQQFTMSRTFASPGVSIIGNVAQTAVIVGDTLASCRTEFVNWFLSGTAYRGNTNVAVAYEYSDVDLRDCSMVSFKNCTFAMGDWGLMLRGGSGCADITVDYCLFYFQLIDCIRILNGGATNRVAVTNSYLADLLHQERTWAKSDGTAPVIASQDPGGGYTKVMEPEHCDLIQGYGAGSGTLYDARIQYNTMKATGGQSVFLDDGFQVRVAVLDNSIQTGGSHAIRMTQATDGEISRNAMTRTASYDPLVVNTITFNRPGGVGNAKGGLNTFPGDSSISTDTGLTLTAAISGTATAPTAPTWSQTTSNVGNLNSLRVTRPSYTDFAGPAECVRDPFIYVDGTTSPYSPGARLKIIHKDIKGYLYPFNSCWVRWKQDGVVQQTTQYTSGGSTAAMVSPVTTAGSWVGGFSFNSTDGTNGTWYDTAAVTVATAGTTLDPADKSTEITLSGGNLTATHTGTDATHANAKSLADVPTATANYVWGVNCSTRISGTQSGIAIIGNAKANTIDPHDFNGPCLAIFADGSMFGSGSFTGNLGNMGGAGKSYADGMFLIYLRRNAGVDKLFVRYPDGTWSSATGDPTGAGAGIDCSAATGGSVLSAGAYTYKTGDVTQMTYAVNTTGLGTVVTL